MAELNPKVVTVSQILEDLNNGLTRWKKDDIGFGSLEKKYNLSTSEMAQILTHPKIKNVESKIPVFVINDDTEPLNNTNTTVEVREEVQQTAQVKTTVVVKEEPVKIEKEKRKVEAFI